MIMARVCRSLDSGFKGSTPAGVGAASNGASAHVYRRIVQKVHCFLKGVMSRQYMSEGLKVLQLGSHWALPILLTTSGFKL